MSILEVWTLILWVTLLVCGVSIICASIARCSEAIVAGLILLLLVTLGWAMVGSTHHEAYRAGQIDALTGKVQYHLVVHPDKTATWEEIEEGK